MNFCVLKHIAVWLCEPAWIAEVDCQQERHTDEHGVEKVGEDGDGVETREAGGDEDLGSVGEESLCEAGGGVEDGGGAAWVDAESGGDVLGNGACGDDGNGVVGGADIDEAGEGSDAEFTASFAVNALCECLDDEVNAAVVADDFEHAACQDGHDDEFCHAHHALVHGGKPPEEVVGAEGDADDAREDDADGEHQKHVHAADGKDDDGEVGEDEPEVHVARLGWRADALAEEVIDNQHDDRHRGDDADVDTELVSHAAPLCLGGDDGGVADEGEVVAEVGATHHKSYHEGHADARLLGNADRQGGEGGNGAATGADAERDEAGGEEDAGQDELLGHVAQGDADGGIHRTHRLGGGGEGTGKDEDGKHQHHRRVACPSGKDLDALVHRASDGQQGIDGTDEERHGNGHFIEVLCHDARDKIQNEEYK